MESLNIEAKMGLGTLIMINTHIIFQATSRGKMINNNLYCVF